jgi:AcrR family transcriptional regulator
LLHCRPAQKVTCWTLQRTLLIAVKEFAARGYSGARVNAISRRAAVNPRMIYHHFGAKERLDIEVLEHVLAELRRDELKLDVDQVRPFAGVMQQFDFIHGHFGSHPELMNLLSGENLLRAQFLRRSTRSPVISSPLIGLIARLLARGQALGEIRPGIDPLHLYIIMVALSYFHRSNAHTLTVLFSTDLLTPPWQAAHKELATRLLESFLRLPGPHRGGASGGGKWRPHPAATLRHGETRRA